ncbi:uncharacterized protein LOC110694860 [Chenopodium quinoa]|uniref:uncharacterized protein LOC110694860 n=1 Tax=Chenopodium quinoa TaxID=63459 RepID=UPI000B789DF3|nr:uncharacterized protein LOC110694860 [Chenopodium quinoa]
MANSDVTSSNESLKKENSALTQSAKLAELSESRTELLSRIQGLKQDLQNWRSKLDNQVQSHRNELVELRKSLIVEVDQLRSEFQDLRTTLQQQQEDVTASLKILGLQDTSKDAGIFAPNPMDAGTTMGHEVNDEGSTAEINESGSSKDEIIAEESTGNGSGTDHLSSSGIGVDIEH